MADRNKTQFAILGTLSRSPRTGYEIKQDLQGALGNFWRENYGSIYPTLKAMEQLALIVGEAESSKGRASRRYRITDVGLGALNAWLLEPTEPMAFRHELLLKFYFSEPISPNERLRLLQTYEQRMRALGDRYEEEFRKHAPSHRCDQRELLRLTNRFGVLYCRMCERWAGESVAALQKVANLQEQTEAADCLIWESPNEGT